MLLDLIVLPSTFAVVRLAPDSDIPKWLSGELVSITRTSAELSIVCPVSSVPRDIQVAITWKCLKVVGPLDFSLVGVLQALIDPLVARQISVFTISTWDTDYLLVDSRSLSDALAALCEAGHRLKETGT